MPAINVFTSAEPLPAQEASALLKRLSRSLAEHLHKPESYVMTCLVPQTRMTMAGSEEPCCFVEVTSIGGLTPNATNAVSADLCAELSKRLGVSLERIYIVFMDIPPSRWAHNGSTFG